MKHILSIIFILSNFYCYSQTNELVVSNKIILAVNVVPILEDVNFVVDKGSKRLRNGVNEHTYFLLSTKELPKTDYPESSWGSCMNKAGRTCMNSWVCRVAYGLSPASYILGWSIGCTLYNDITRFVKSTEEILKETLIKSDY